MVLKRHLWRRYRRSVVLRVGHDTRTMRGAAAESIVSRRDITLVLSLISLTLYYLNCCKADLSSCRISGVKGLKAEVNLDVLLRDPP